MRVIISILFFFVLTPSSSFGFCGFFVAKADASLYNKASQVVFVRDGKRTALTIVNDYKGNPKEFALVVPVPVVLKRSQINVGNLAIVRKADAFSAPRLVEYFDSDPCAPQLRYNRLGQAKMGAAGASLGGVGGKSHGVTVEAKYTIGEYDIVILSAKDSSGLEAWLRSSGYKIPKGAAKALKPYIKQKLKFFVAKVNLKEKEKLGFTYLRPLQFAFETEKFMLPIRLGMINADGDQDLLIYLITKNGRVETTNYRTVKLPSGNEVPVFVKEKFPSFYRDMFETVHKRENKRVVFMEYAWNMGWCDPCAADPLTPEELRKLGVSWLEDKTTPIRPQPLPGPRRRIIGPVQAYITRLHVRYNKKTFPEDLFFQTTSDTKNFQGRYVLRHPWTGEMKCEQALTYKMNLEQRRKKEAETLASLTGWSIGDIYKQMGKRAPKSVPEKKWYENIFK